MASSVAILLLVALELPGLWVAVLGALIASLEAILCIHWITYRSTCEAMKHEKYLNQAFAGQNRSQSIH